MFLISVPPFSPLLHVESHPSQRIIVAMAPPCHPQIVTSPGLSLPVASTALKMI